MTIYYALLRGINVGRSNRIKMADLKEILADIGLTRTQTYIQSGNVIFESNEDEGPLREKIERTVEEMFGFSTTVVLRTAAEVRKLIADCPFSPEAIREAGSSSPVEVLYVALLVNPPQPESRKILDMRREKEEEYRIAGRDIFLLLPNGIRRSRLVSNLDRLGVPSTIRNWKTLRKLDELAHAIA
ncbi:MAG: DUF1697 domain-containing protein [Methanomassiliicoccus sp.]|nr:DUF1697 domain-containing protein [Methanomassiliicoccus sp.]